MRTVKRVICVLIAFLFVIVLIGKDAKATPYGGAFLGIKGSARIQALGNAAAGLDKTVDGLLYNPASLAGLDSFAISLAYQYQMFGNHYSEVLIANNFGFGRIGIAFSMLTIPMGPIVEWGEIGEKKSLFDISLGLIYQRDIGMFSFAVGAKFINEDLGAESSPTAAFDMGILFRVNSSAEKNRFNFGIYARNLGLGMKFDQVRDNLNMKFGGGIFWLPSRWVSFVLDGTYSMNGSATLNSGMEIAPLWILTPRVGYEVNFKDIKRSSLSLGLGFGKEFGSTTIRVDYGFNMFYLPGSHYVSMKIMRPALWMVKKKAKKIPWDGTKPIRIAVADFSAKKAPEALAKSSANFLRHDFAQSDALIVIRRDKMKAVLEEQQLQMTGITSPDDAVGIGQILNVAKMAFGTISKVGSEYYIEVSIVDVETGAVDTSVEEVAGSVAEIRNAIKKIAFHLDPAQKE